jgi:hypothetical protein
VVRLNFAYKANKLVLDGDQVALQYLTNLTGAVSIQIKSIVNINVAANRERARGGLLSIKLMMQQLMSEAIQHQKDVSLQNFGVMGSTSMDLDVIQTTAASVVSAGKELKTMQTEIEVNKAGMNTFRTKFQCRENFQPRCKDKDKEGKDPFKCFNCGEANYMARHCMMTRKKEAGKAQDQ